jgi:ATP-dependent RNA circularization protein (DNA/RNA ligase family)
MIKRFEDFVKDLSLKTESKNIEDENKSRRVEFRILTKSEESIDKINDQLQ